MNKSEITDEEIKGMMDFQQVLDKHRKAVAARSAKYWAGGVATLIISSLVLYYFTGTTSTPAPKSPNPSTLSQQPIPVVPKEDSIEKKVELAEPVVKKVPPSKANKTSQPATKASSEIAKADIYLPSEPVDGYPNLYKYFNDQLTYPKEAAKDSIQGVVSVTFIVRPTGKVDHITITNSLGPLFDAEAIRVMQGMPVWKPALLNGKPVPSKMSVPLTFRIEPTKK